MALPDRFEPWHVLVVAAFLVGAGGSLLGSGTEGFVLVIGLKTVLSGLLWAFAVYIFVGTFRNYVTSYSETGGSLWDPRFLAPFAVGVLAAAALVGWRLPEEGVTPSLVAAALSAGFWAFVLAMVAVLTASYVVAGYREAQ
ncbi:hypothetical protein [Halolamina sediminis]|jgi:hypothetical protein|uniref:hypothetical protein n=1 Tax=Halolamina sediminis TaxID=1480675 RepID=UPI0006B6553C|nr:hypothetical protein [Halolamina sediminis]